MKFHFQDFKEVLNFGLYTIFTKFSSLITSSINQLFIGILVGTGGVTIFNVPFKIILRFNSLIYRISFIVFPLSSELSAVKDNDKLRSVYLKLSKYIFILISIFFIPLISFPKEILHYWMGPDFAVRGSYVMLMCCLAFYLISLTMVTGLVALGLGQPKYNAFFSFLTAFINIVLIFPFTKLWGINGAATALFISSLQAPIMIYVTSTKVVGVNFKKYASFVVGRSVYVILVALLISHLFLRQLITSLFLFICISLGEYLLLAALFYALSLGREEKRLLRNSLLVLINRLRIEKA
jgi:O-antigen/teichoic acid export membrane protein